jgi:hypothetical protein
MATLKRKLSIRHNRSSSIVSSGTITREFVDAFELNDDSDSIKTIRIDVVEARDLINVDSGILGDVSDPYVEIYVGGLRSQLQRTKVIKNNLNPVWNETFDLRMFDPMHTIIVLQTWDKNKVSKDVPLGETAIALEHLHLVRGQPLDVWATLQNVSGGRVHLRLTPLDFSIHSEDGGTDPVVSLTLDHPACSIGGYMSITAVLDGHISKQEDYMFDQSFGVVYLEDLMSTMSTGDIILHSGIKLHSRAIELAFNSLWSHCAMILKNPSQEMRKTYQLEKKQDIFVVEAWPISNNHPIGGGVRITPVTKWVVNHFSEHNRVLLGFRKLQRDEKSVPEISSFVNFLEQAKSAFYGSVEKMLKCIWRKNTKDDLRRWTFCSELVAGMLECLGVLTEGLITSNFSPKDFSSQTDTLNKILQPNVKYDREKRLRIRKLDETKLRRKE